MQIILKQRDIEAALKQYIAGQGISLHGKNVSVEFTAGRKESGITAEIDIEDGGDVITPVVLGVVTTLASTPVVADPEPKQDAPEPEAEPAPVATGGSLFN